MCDVLSSAFRVEETRVKCDSAVTLKGHFIYYPTYPPYNDCSAMHDRSLPKWKSPKTPESAHTTSGRWESGLDWEYCIES